MKAPYSILEQINMHEKSSARWLIISSLLWSFASFGVEKPAIGVWVKYNQGDTFDGFVLFPPSQGTSHYWGVTNVEYCPPNGDLCIPPATRVEGAYSWSEDRLSLRSNNGHSFIELTNTIPENPALYVRNQDGNEEVYFSSKRLGYCQFDNDCIAEKNAGMIEASCNSQLICNTKIRRCQCPR